MNMNWFRWYHGAVSDPKLALIAKKSGQTRPIVIAIWAALLEHASQAESRGDISGFDAETVAVALDIDEDAIPAVIAAMTTKGMITDGVITAWDRRQPQREDGAAERAKAWREKQKQSANATERNRTQPNAGKRQEEEEIRVDGEERRKEVSQKRKEAAQAPCASPPVSPVIVSSAPKAAQAPKPVKVIKSTIPAHWIPTEATYALLEKNGIDRPFAEGCLDEFRLYWTERQEQRPGWETTFLNNVKRQWAHRTPPATPTPRNGPRYAPPPRAMTPEVAEFDAILRNLNAQNLQPVIEGECSHVAH